MICMATGSDVTRVTSHTNMYNSAGWAKYFMLDNGSPIDWLLTAAQ